MVLTSIFMSLYNNANGISDSEIEERARNLGMHYSDECKVLFKEEEENHD